MNERYNQPHPQNYILQILNTQVHTVVGRTVQSSLADLRLQTALRLEFNATLRIADSRPLSDARAEEKSSSNCGRVFR